MRSIRALPLLLLLPLIPAVWAALASEAAPRPDRSARPWPLFVPAPAEVSKPLPGLHREASPATDGVRPDAALSVAALSTPSPERARWPDHWPRLDPVRAGGTSGTQTMGTGDIDVETPAGSDDEEPPDLDPVEPDPIIEKTPRKPEFFEEGRPVPHVPGEPPFRSVHITRGRWQSQYAPPERVAELEQAQPLPPTVPPREGGRGERVAAPPAEDPSPDPVGETTPPEEVAEDGERAPTPEELDRIHRRAYRHVPDGADASEMEVVYPDEEGDDEKAGEWRDIDINWEGADEDANDDVEDEGEKSGEKPREPIIRGETPQFGSYLPDKKESRYFQPSFDLPGTHTFGVTIQSATWATPAQEEVEIAGDGQGFIDLNLDTSGLSPGLHKGTLILTCRSCDVSHVVEIPIEIQIVYRTTFGSHPADGEFGGLDDQGQPRSARDLFRYVIAELQDSSFGQDPRGAAILKTLRGWVDDIIIVPTVDAPAGGGDARAPRPGYGRAKDGDTIRPGEGQYQFIPGRGPLGRIWPFYSEEFYIGLDLSTQGIEEARKNPADYYVFTLDGKMGVVRKDDLVHSLPHEGLHAHHVGKYNIKGKGASNEEERDGFRAGNTAADALGLPPQRDAPGYGGSNPDYQPLFPPKETPSETPMGEGGGPAQPEEGASRKVALIHPIEHPEALGGPSGRGDSAAPVEVLILSTGGSTGTVARMYVVNHGEPDEPLVPVRIVATGAVLEPAEPDPATRARIEEIQEAVSSGKPVPRAPAGSRGAGPMALPPEWSGSNVFSFDIDAYCLEFAGGVPTDGTFFRIADAPTQAANAPLRAILAASRLLRDRGKIHPDSDPTAYFHSLRQWAIWVDENDLDRAGFEKAFVEHARKNFEAAGRTWTREVERTVRSLVPNRWNDVVAVLEGAGLPVRNGGR